GDAPPDRVVEDEVRFQPDALPGRADVLDHGVEQRRRFGEDREVVAGDADAHRHVEPVWGYEVHVPCAGTRTPRSVPLGAAHGRNQGRLLNYTGPPVRRDAEPCLARRTERRATPQRRACLAAARSTPEAVWCGWSGCVLAGTSWRSATSGRWSEARR